MADQDRREGEYLSLEEAREVIADATGRSVEDLADASDAVEIPPPEEGELEPKDC